MERYPVLIQFDWIAPRGVAVAQLNASGNRLEADPLWHFCSLRAINMD
jgi:hypothetical protein